MMRRLYILIIWMHPAPFRQRFGDEMLADFDDSRGTASARLMGDILVSLFRQWVLRPEFRDSRAVAAPVAMGVPAFQSLEDYQPSRGAMCYGGILSIGIFFAIAFALGHPGIRRVFSVGIQRPGLGLISMERSAFQESPDSHFVQMGREPEDSLRAIVSYYFKANLVARALDADRDLLISSSELANAPAALAKLDLDGDGKLSAEECGFRGMLAARDPKFLERARMSYMRVNPLEAALDTDRDGEISANEIRNSVASLKTVDQNRDGILTPREIMPDFLTGEMSRILLRLDTDGDGTISLQEKSAVDAEPLREFLEHADRDRDGRVTEAELLIALRRQYESKRELERGLWSLGWRRGR